MAKKPSDPKAKTETTNSAGAIVKTLIENGVDTVFGIPGVQLDELFNAFYEHQDQIRLINPRHEQSSAYMAMGYAMATGNVGTCVAVPGPGVLNTSAALATAYGNNAPVMCLVGQIPSNLIDQGFGILHEIADQPGTLSSVTKWQGRVTAVEEVAPVLETAFANVESGRKRPVLVETAPDILMQGGTVTIQARRAAPPPPPLSQSDVDHAAYLLRGAKNPAIFVGGGALDASAEILGLAELLQAPVFMSQDGLGVVDYRHPLGQNMLAGADFWSQIDVVLAIGTRFVMPMLNWGHDDDIKLIRVDIDETQPVHPWVPDVRLTTDAAVAARDLTKALSGDIPGREDRTDEFNQLKAKIEAQLVENMAESHALNSAIRKALPEDGIICFDITQLGYHAWWGFPIYAPRTMIQQGYQGTLGYSLPTALGAKVAFPDRPVVCVVGDGGFMFSVQELAVAVQEKINLIIVLVNDGGYGNVRRYQKQNYNGNFIACDLHQPDFMALTKSFGMASCRVETAQELEGALTDAFGRDEPMLIELTVGELPSWQTLFPRHRLRGS